MDYVPVLMLCVIDCSVAAHLDMTGGEQGTSVAVTLDPDKRPHAVIGLFAIALHAVLNAYEMGGELPALWAEECAHLRRIIAATDKELGDIVARENDGENWDGD
jgi:hypothetical protein